MEKFITNNDVTFVIKHAHISGDTPKNHTEITVRIASILARLLEHASKSTIVQRSVIPLLLHKKPVRRPVHAAKPLLFMGTY